MGFFLMNGDKKTIYYDFYEGIIEVLDNAFLPLPLKDYIKSTRYDNKDVSIQSSQHLTALRDYLSGRVLSLSRENAKEILNSVSLPQSNKTEERIAIVTACNGLSVTDNIWIKDEIDGRMFSEVCLRKKHLSEAAYGISMLGKRISVEKDVMIPDIGTAGMFRKTWHRTDDGRIQLWKSDRLTENANVLAEKQA